jgi:radical SAM protein with 4Fe4S-binding SPASM domain
MPKLSTSELEALKTTLSCSPNVSTHEHVAKIHLLIEYIRIAQLKFQKPLQTPLEVGLVITDRCNSNCIHCWASGLNRGNDLPTKVLKSVIEKLADANVLHTTLTGGESFLRPDIFDLITHLKEYGIAVTILTNGTLLAESVVSKLARILDEDDIIQVSLDGPNETIYSKQRGLKAFCRVIDGIKLLKKYGITVRTHFVATFVNVNYLVDTYMLSNDLNVDTFSCSPVYPQSKGEKIYDRAVELKYLKEVAKLNIVKDTNGLETMIYPVLPILAFKTLYNNYNDRKTTEEMPLFLVENSMCTINIDGKLFPGNLLHFKEFLLGDIKEQSLTDIWSDAHEKKILPLTRDLRGTKCIKCKFLHLCRGGDVSLTYKAYRTFDRPDPYCTLVAN